MNTTRKTSPRTRVALAALVLTLAVPSAAQAWWRGGWGFGLGFGPVVVVPPPLYVGPPPVYYGPPPAAYAPAPAGPACYAGPYVCPLDNAAPVGGPCSCPTNDNGRIGGRVG